MGSGRCGRYANTYGAKKCFIGGSSTSENSESGSSASESSASKSSTSENSESGSSTSGSSTSGSSTSGSSTSGSSTSGSSTSGSSTSGSSTSESSTSGSSVSGSSSSKNSASESSTSGSSASGSSANKKSVKRKSNKKKIISNLALRHANEGKFIQAFNPKRMRLHSGGHGEANIQLLKKYGIKYKIVKTYPNGVRVGYIPDHKDKLKKKGIGQSWFPKNWTKKDIRHAGEHVASLKANKHLKNGHIGFGNWMGVRVGIIKTKGEVATIFPDSIQPIKKVKKRKKRK